MFKLLRKSQEVQYQWIRNHPVQFLVLNVGLAAVALGYFEYQDRRDARKRDDEIDPQSN